MAENNVPVWIAALAAVGAGGVSSVITAVAKFRRTPAEQDVQENSMLTAALKENRELRTEFDKIWQELSDCQRHHRECLRIQQEAADRAARLETELAKLAGKVADIQEQQRAA